MIYLLRMVIFHSTPLVITRGYSDWTKKNGGFFQVSPMKNQPFGDTMGAPSKVTQCLGSPLGCWRPKRSPFGLVESPTTNAPWFWDQLVLSTRSNLCCFPKAMISTMDQVQSGSIRWDYQPQSSNPSNPSILWLPAEKKKRGERNPHGQSKPGTAQLRPARRLAFNPKNMENELGWIYQWPFQELEVLVYSIRPM